MVTNTSTFIFLFVCYAVMAYESVIGVVRVQDFFLAKFKKYYFDLFLKSKIFEINHQYHFIEITK